MSPNRTLRPGFDFRLPCDEACLSRKKVEYSSITPILPPSDSSSGEHACRKFRSAIQQSGIGCGKPCDRKLKIENYIWGDKNGEIVQRPIVAVLWFCVTLSKESHWKDGKMPDRKNAAEANGKVADRSKTASKTDAAKDRQKDDGGTQNKSPKKRRKVNHGKHLFRSACLRYPSPGLR